MNDTNLIVAFTDPSDKNNDPRWIREAIAGLRTRVFTDDTWQISARETVNDWDDLSQAADDARSYQQFLRETYPVAADGRIYSLDGRLYVSLAK